MCINNIIMVLNKCINSVNVWLNMRMTILTDGLMKLVLNKAVSLGIAKTKNEALRLGMI